MRSSSFERDDPLVTVVIPTKDRPDYLRSAIESVLNQTFTDFEVIVVDDGTSEVAADLVRDTGDSRFVFTKNVNASGSSGARNTGIELARGDFIAFLDDDDEWLPTKVEKQLGRFEQLPQSVGLVYCDAIFVDSHSGKEIQRHAPRYRGDVYQRLFDGMTGPRTPTVMIRSVCFDQCGLFDEELLYAEEADLWIRIAKEFDFDFVADCLVQVRRTHRNRLTTDDWAQIVGYQRLLSKYGDAFGVRRRAGIAIRMGNAYCHLGNLRQGRSHLTEAIRLRPRQIKTYFYWASTWLPKVLYDPVRQLKRRFSFLLPRGW